MEQVTVDAIAAYCRNHKVDAAVAIASQLDVGPAKRITSVHGLLTKLNALDSMK